MALAVLGVLVLGAGAGVVAAHGRGGTARPVAAASPSATLSGTPSDTSSSTPSDTPTPTTTPTTTPSNGAFGPPPAASDPATVVATSPLGAIGRAYRAQGWTCLAEHDSPTVGACYGPDSAAVLWLGSGDRPDSLDAFADTAAGLDRALALLPAATGWTAADTAAVRAGTGRTSDEDLRTAWGEGHVWPATASETAEVRLDRAGSTVPYPPFPAPTLGGMADYASRVPTHGYTCHQDTAGHGVPRLTCTKGERRLVVEVPDDAADGITLTAEGSSGAVDDLLRLVYDVNRGYGARDVDTIVTLVDSVRGKDHGVTAGRGWMAVCHDDGQVGCQVTNVVW